MKRETCQRILRADQPWGLAVVGGGATGVSIAVDAAAHGYQVVLLEQSNWGKGTSSRSTKPVHGDEFYHDARFDDSRLLVNLAQTAAERGACLLDYARVAQLMARELCRDQSWQQQQSSEFKQIAAPFIVGPA